MNLFSGKITIFRMLVLVSFGIFIIDISKSIIAPFLQSNDGRILPATGKWQADVIQTGEKGPYAVRKTIEFIEPNKIIYNQFLLRQGRIQTIEFYNLTLRYQFLSENQMVLNARVSDEWTITKNGGNLIISGASFVGNGEYRQVVSVSWHLVAMLIALLVFWAFHVLYLSYLNCKKEQSELDKKELFKTASPLHKLGKTLMLVIMFGIGAYVGTIAWSWWPRLFIRIPWDGVILLEINLLILAIGLKLAISPKPKSETVHLIFSRWQYYASIIIASLGFSGSLTSLLLLSLSMITNGFLL